MGEFCGCNQKKLALGLGIALAVVLGIEGIIIIALALAKIRDGGRAPTFLVYLFGFGTITLLGLIATLIFIVGVIKMKKCLLWIWIVCGILLVLGYLTFFGIAIFLLFVNEDIYAAIDLPFIIIILILTIFSIIVVWGLKKEAE